MKPLALLVYQKIVPGSQLKNRLEDIGYRVATFTEPSDMVAEAKLKGPMLIFVDLESGQGGEMIEALKALRDHAETAHVPVIAFGPTKGKDLMEYAHMAGAKIVVDEDSVLTHLDDLMERALQLD